MLTYTRTPVIEINHPVLSEASVRLLVKREDLNHAEISGNKWWKLKYNIEEAVRQGKQTLLTFGGAYSNHIYAVASAASNCNLKSIGIIRGERTLPLNKTLSFASSKGMQLQYLSRADYKRKTEHQFVEDLKAKFGDFHLIPEGGTNMLALKGCSEFAKHELSEIGFDQLFLPVGTGGTMAGIIAGLKGQKKITGISVLKNGDFLIDEARSLLLQFEKKDYGNWSVLTSYDQGGYAKVTKELLEFVSAMKVEHNLPLDHVYTGKLFLAIFQEIESGNIADGSTLLALHTGGLQGS